MKKNIFLLVFLCCLLVLFGCEKASGEETLPSANETTQSTQNTTMPPETTAPPETTVPEETTAPLVTEDIPYLRIPDQVPRVDPQTPGTVIHVPELDPSGLVTAMHIRFFTKLSTENTYRDGVFLVCTDEQEMKSGSHYQGYTIENGQLKVLENRTFAKEISFLEGKTYLEFQYAVNEDKIIITYEPHLYDDNGFYNQSCVVDTSRGLTECLVSLTYVNKKDEEWILTQYFDLLNLETGEFRGLLTGFDTAIFQSRREFVAWTEDGNLVFYNRGSYELFDISTKTVLKDYSYSDQSLIYDKLYVDGKSYLEVTDPINGEKVLLKVPEGWDSTHISWWPSPDGRKLMARYGKNLLIYDGDRNMWIEIPRDCPGNILENIHYWTEDGEIVLVSDHQKNVSVYRFSREE